MKNVFLVSKAKLTSLLHDRAFILAIQKELPTKDNAQSLWLESCHQSMACSAATACFLFVDRTLVLFQSWTVIYSRKLDPSPKQGEWKIISLSVSQQTYPSSLPI